MFKLIGTFGTLALIINIVSTFTEVRKITEPSIMLFKGKSVLVRAGSYHLVVTTNINPSDDARKMEKLSNQLSLLCESASNRFKDLSCAAQVDEIGQLVNQTRKTIDNVKEKSIHSRSKRSYHEGILSSLWHYIVGYNEPDTNTVASKSAGAILHTDQALKDVEVQLTKKGEHLDQEIDFLFGSLRNESTKSWTEIDKNRFLIQFLGTKDNVKTVLGHINKRYDILANPLNSVNIQQAITTINTKFQGLTVPDMAIDKLAALSSKQYQLNNDSLDCIVALPLVYNSVWNSFMTVPMPGDSKNQIPISDPQTLIFNKKHDLYFKTDRLFDVNDTVQITAEIVDIFFKSLASEDCAIRSVVTNTQECQLRMLPLKYDEWFQTPVHNTFAYYSNQIKALSCGDEKSKIEQQSGIIEIKSGCTLHTPTKMIAATVDKTSIKSFYFKIDELNINTTNIKEHSSSLQVMQHAAKINDGLVDNAIEEAENLPESDGNILWIVLGASIAAIIILSLIIFLLYKLIIKPQYIPPPPPPIDIELMERTRRPNPLFLPKTYRDNDLTIESDLFSSTPKPNAPIFSLPDPDKFSLTQTSPLNHTYPALKAQSVFSTLLN